VEARIGAADGRVLPHEEHPLDLAAMHVHEHWEVGPVAVDPGQELISKFVLGRRRVPEIRLEQGDHVLADVRPEAGAPAFVPDIAVQVGIDAQMGGHVQVAGQQVIQCRDVGRSLDGGVASERLDSAARAPDVAQQELEDG